MLMFYWLRQRRTQTENECQHDPENDRMESVRSTFAVAHNHPPYTIMRSSQ